MKIKVIKKGEVVLSKEEADKIEEINESYATLLAKTIKLESNLKNQRRLAFTLSEENIKLKQDNAESKKIIKKLKALCTRNMVDYSKVVEKEEETNGTRGKKTKKTI